MKRGREKGGKCKRKGRKGKLIYKRISKTVKTMQNREELRQKGHDRSLETTCCERGKHNFQKGGINIFVGLKYKPLLVYLVGLDVG